MNPTSEPTNPTPPPAPPVVGRGLVEYVRTNRDTTAYILLGLSVVFLVLTIVLAVRAFRTPPTKIGEKPPDTKTFDRFNPEANKPTEVSNPKRYDYMIGGIGVLAAFLTTAAAGAWVLVGIPPPTEDRQRSEARLVILIVGAVLGAVLALVGLLYLYLWGEALVAWLDRSETKQARWVMIPLLMVIVGAGLIFLAAQPARAEERNNPNLRRLVYGANFGLTILLVLIMLVTGNVVFALKAPNQLDTTQTGFYTLNDTTKSFVSQLDPPITAYLVMPDLSGREANDIRQVLLSYQEAAGGKFSVRFVNPVTEKGEVRRLSERYSKLDKDGMGILLVAGSDDQSQTAPKHAYIPVQELLTTTSGPNGKPIEAFAGEGRILRELRFLSESGEKKPVVYFTQSNGELALSGRTGPDMSVPSQSAVRFQQFLESSYSVDVKPLTFPPSDPSPKVPDDAAVVVVAEPQTPLSDGAVNALRKYMAEKKGRLMVLAGAVAGLDNRGMARTGLEGLLSEYNVNLGTQFLFTVPLDPRLNPRDAYAEFNRRSGGQRHPITQSFGTMTPIFVLPQSRPVSPLSTNPALQAATILHTHPDLPTWLEDDQLAQVGPALRELRNEGVQRRKDYSENPRSVMVAVSETGGSGRVVVIGNSVIISDEASASSRGGSTPVSYALVGVSLDWLRDRP
ncbi:MAG TPA: Gldg family protein, partial [Gemmataceae bacterium]|nr:Gldg family protein [Gemmataceae bacterium]